VKVRVGRAALGALGATWLCLQWSSRRRGASASERARPLPGDDLVPGAQVQITRAATLPAPPEQVWPWLVQMGWGRGGWYTQRWVDRLLFPANRPSADAVVPELQELAVGEFVPDGPPETECGFVVEQLDAGRLMVLHSTSHLPVTWRRRGIASVDWTWSFNLRAVDGGRATRLVFRWRSRTSPVWLTAGAQALVVPADWVMSRGMLRGLGHRVSSGPTRRGAGRSAARAGARG
jgi:hypothetical protein